MVRRKPGSENVKRELFAVLLLVSILGLVANSYAKPSPLDTLTQLTITTTGITSTTTLIETSTASTTLTNPTFINPTTTTTTSTAFTTANLTTFSTVKLSATTTTSTIPASVTTTQTSTQIIGTTLTGGSNPPPGTFSLSFGGTTIWQCNQQILVTLTGPFSSWVNSGDQIQFSYYQQQSSGSGSNLFMFSDPSSLNSQPGVWLSGNTIQYYIQPSEWNYISFQTYPYIHVTVKDLTVPTNANAIVLYTQDTGITASNCGGTAPPQVSQTYATIYQTGVVTQYQYVTEGGVVTVGGGTVTAHKVTTTPIIAVTSFRTNATMNVTETTPVWSTALMNVTSTNVQVSQQIITDTQQHDQMLTAIVGLFGVGSTVQVARWNYYRKHPEKKVKKVPPAPPPSAGQLEPGIVGINQPPVVVATPPSTDPIMRTWFGDEPQ